MLQPFTHSCVSPSRTRPDKNARTASCPRGSPLHTVPTPRYDDQPRRRARAPRSSWPTPAGQNRSLLPCRISVRGSQLLHRPGTSTPREPATAGSPGSSAGRVRCATSYGYSRSGSRRRTAVSRAAGRAASGVAASAQGKRRSEQSVARCRPADSVVEGERLAGRLLEELLERGGVAVAGVVEHLSGCPRAMG